MTSDLNNEWLVETRFFTYIYEWGQGESPNQFSMTVTAHATAEFKEAVVEHADILMRHFGATTMKELVAKIHSEEKRDMQKRLMLLEYDSKENLDVKIVQKTKEQINEAAWLHYREGNWTLDDHVY